MDQNHFVPSNMTAKKMTAMFFIFLNLMLMAIPPTSACAPCYSPKPKHPPHHKGHHKKPPTKPPIIVPPIILPPPLTNPPIIVTPPSPWVAPPPYVYPTCPIDALKLGLCLDVLGGLVHVGIGDPVVHVCCPVIQGLLELEAAVCLCTAIRLRLLNLNVFLPLAIQALITCGKTPPPGFVCPPLLK